jgi:hypothetical protein
MLEIFMIFAMFGGVVSILLSKSKKNYEKLAEDNGLEFAEKTTRRLKKHGYGLLLLSILYFIYIYFRYRL